MDGTRAVLERVGERRACACELLPTFSCVRMSLLLLFPGEYIWSRSRDPAVPPALFNCCRCHRGPHRVWAIQELIGAFSFEEGACRR